jgi:hypothetical protein
VTSARRRRSGVHAGSKPRPTQVAPATSSAVATPAAGETSQVPPAPDFAALTKAQRRVVDAVGAGDDDVPWASKRTIARLVELGFVEEREERLPGALPIFVRRYGMPIHVHMAWCQTCSDEVDAAGGEEAYLAERDEKASLAGRNAEPLSLVVERKKRRR